MNNCTFTTEKLLADLAAEHICTSEAFLEEFCVTCPFDECPVDNYPLEHGCWKEFVINDMLKEIAQCVKIAMHI